jgi:hypothetical protein
LSQFFQVGAVLNREKLARDNDGKYNKEIFIQEFYLQPEQIAHKRATYDLVGLLGDMGGIQGILISLLGVLVVPVSAHSFNIKAARKLFMARSESSDLFMEVPKEKLGIEFDEELIKSQTPKMEKEIRKHYVPSIHLYDSCMLFFSTWFGRCFSDYGC